MEEMSHSFNIIGSDGVPNLLPFPYQMQLDSVFRLRERMETTGVGTTSRNELGSTALRVSLKVEHPPASIISFSLRKVLL